MPILLLRSTLQGRWTNYPPRFSATPQEGNKFQMWSLFPFIARDIAVFVPENVKSAEVEKIIKANMGDMVIKGPELLMNLKMENFVCF